MAITKVYLLSVPLEKDYAHTLYFANKTAQNTYFQGRVKLKYEDFTYQRKDGVIRIPDQIDTLWKHGVNYVMYQNPDYNDKWFYAFITDMQYINDGRTDLTIKTDCLQTWMFDKLIKPCFVEREHTANDTVGENTVPEGLELGEYTANLHTKADYGGDIINDSIVIVGVTKDPDGTNVAGDFYHGLYSGVRYYGFTNNEIIDDELNTFLSKYDEGIADAVVCMFMAPKSLVVLKDDYWITGSNLPQWCYINYSGDPHEGLEHLYKNVAMSTENLDGYTPRNKKLLAFPFRYLLVSNNAGAAVPFKYERFYKNEETGKTIIPPEFIIEGTLTPGCSVRMVPLHYNGVERNDDEGINLGKYPILNWTSDVYTNWLTQNGVNIALEIVSGVGQVIAGAAIAAGSGGLATAVGGGGVVGGVSQIASTLSQIHTQSFAAPQVKGNLNSGDVVTTTDQNDFHFYDMTIKAEYARIIDEYFDVYGYKTHRVKQPASGHRENYWYTKTIDANISGLNNVIPQEDLQTIKDCYNRGITYWRNPDLFKNYTVSNGIV